MKRHLTRTLTTAVAICSLLANAANACTGITLKAKDGSVVFGRTLEWGSFDLHSRVVIVPRGHVFKALTPDGSAGRTWTAAYGAVGLDAVEKDFIVDGMNEKGLSVNVFYHPGYAEYPAYDPAKASTSMGSLDVAQYLLTTTTTVEEARKAIAGIQVIGIVERDKAFRVLGCRKNAGGVLYADYLVLRCVEDDQRLSQIRNTVAK